jgi:head-tail adaptor
MVVQSLLKHQQYQHWGGNTQPTIFNYTVTWSDGSPITANTALAAGDKKTVKVRIEYKKDITAAQLPSADTALSLTCSIPYVQA